MAMSPKELDEITESIARDPKVSATARVRALEILARRQAGAAGNGRVPNKREPEYEADPLEDMDELAQRRKTKVGA